MNKKKDGEMIPLPLVVIKCQWWLEAIMTQIDRIEKNVNSNIYEKQVQRSIDDFFLRDSLKHFCDWIKELDKYAEETKELVTKLYSLYDIKLLRDVYAHEIEYYKGEGNIQNKFIIEEYNQSILRALIINDVYYIGGVINLNELKQIMNEAKQILFNLTFTPKQDAIIELNKLFQEIIV